MKTKLFLSAIVFFMVLTAQAQEVNEHYIEVTGTSEIEIMPDKIHYIIEIREYFEEEFDGKSKPEEYHTKVPLSQIEQGLRKKLSEVGITQDVIRTQEIGDYWRKQGQDFLISKQFDITLTDFKQIDEIIKHIDTKGINTMRIGELENKDMLVYHQKENIMNIEDVKQIPIADYLHSLGYSPVKRQGNGLWYKSPLREEHEASFKVNTDRNLWYDFGAGKGGNIIALAKELYFSDSLPYLLKRIEEQTPNVRPVSFSFPQCRTEPSFQHLEVRDLTHPALLRYLQGRGINIELAKRECKELHFTNNGKPFFAIGFPNMAGGYEVRNSFFKGCIAPKDITHIRQQGEPREKCLVFEGFMDYLSFLTLRMKNCPTMPDLDRQDYVILNSTVNVPKAIDVLYPYERIHCMLDNDEAGYKATRAIELEYSYRVRDFSHNYRGYSDLNDYLCGRKQEQKNAASQVQETKQKTGQCAVQKQKRGRGI